MDQPSETPENAWIERLLSAAPESYSAADLAALRTWLVESAAARVAVQADERLSAAVAAALAPAGWSLDEVMAGAERPARPVPRPCAIWSTAIVFFLLGTTLGLGVAGIHYSEAIRRWVDRGFAEGETAPPAEPSAGDPAMGSVRPSDLPADPSEAAGSVGGEGAAAALEPAVSSAPALVVGPPPAKESAAASNAAGDGEAPSASADEAADHPLVLTLSKPGFNLIAAFRAALADGAADDACRMLVRTEPDEDLGLLPDSSQPGLWTAYGVFLRRFLQDHPDLEPAVRQEAGALGELRLAAAIRDRDAAGVEATADRFPGTAAAAQAYRWLGDRMVAIGDALRATGYYRRMLACCPVTDRPQGEARQRLAAALAGQDNGIAAAGPLEYAGLRLQGKQYERLLRELVDRHPAGAAARGGIAAPDVPPAPAALPSELRQWTELSVGDGLWRDSRDKHADIDWLARAIGSAATDTLVLLATPAQIVALQQDSGKAKWTQDFAGRGTSSRLWDGTPFRPLVAGDRVFVRHLPKGAPRLYGLDIDKGRILWESETGLYVVCDPLWDQDRFVALTVEVAPGAPERARLRSWEPWSRHRKMKPDSLLQLTSFDAESGDVVAQRPLLRFRDAWHTAISCRATWIDDRLVATLGGVTLCADIGGRVAWVRKHRWTPPGGDSNWTRLLHPAPQLAGSRVLVAQPGVHAIHCLDIETGSLVWERDLPDLRRVIGLTHDRLIVQSDRELIALGLEDGGNAWTRSVEEPLEAFLCGGAGGLICGRWERVDDRRWQPVLVRLDPVAGTIVAEQRFEELASVRRYPAGIRPRLGPFLSLGDRLFVGQTDGEPRARYRRLWELVAASE